MPQPNVHGRFVWQELIAKDTAASAAFYSKVVGWRTQAAPRTPEYTVFAVDGAGVAGLQPLSGDARGAGAVAHWLPYIGAQNVDETAAAAVRLGGKLIKAPYDLPDGGRVAEVADPQGASFGLYHSSHPGSAPADSQGPGQFSWQELATTDYEAAFDFYRELFGWQVMERMNMGDSMVYLIFGWDGAQRGGIYKSSKPGAGAFWLPYATVKDIDATVAAVAKAGGQVVNGPMPVPDGGRIAQLLDTNGAMFAVHALPSAAPAASAPKPEAAKPAALKPPKAQAIAKTAAPTKAAAPAAATAPATPAPKPADAAAPAAAPAPAAVKKSASPKPPVAAAPAAAKKRAAARKPAAATKSAAAAAAKKKLSKRASAAAAKPAARKAAAGKKPARKTRPKPAARKGRAAAVKRASAPLRARKPRRLARNVLAKNVRAKKKTALAARRKK
jgi:predicted enzyme related to lactoylglutathione lyase